jgi:hypothetical protein
MELKNISIIDEKPKTKFSKNIYSTLAIRGKQWE